MNTASRLQTTAPAGRLLVGAETHQATRDAIEYEAHTAVDVKGKSELLETWLAVAPLTDPGERRVVRAPLVGRSREIELMRSVWSRCLAELKPHLVTVLGPPGIGKSRLCREFSQQVKADGGRFLQGRCLPYQERVGYQAFAGIMRTAGGILESDTPQVALDKLQHAVSRVMSAEEAAETTGHLALLLGLDECRSASSASAVLLCAALSRVHRP